VVNKNGRLGGARPSLPFLFTNGINPLGSLFYFETISNAVRHVLAILLQLSSQDKTGFAFEFLSAFSSPLRIGRILKSASPDRIDFNINEAKFTERAETTCLHPPFLTSKSRNPHNNKFGKEMRTISKFDPSHPMVIALKAELSSLHALPITTKEERDIWYTEAKLFGEKLHGQWSEIYVLLPHELEHYLADADIRAKDGVYRKHQECLLSELLPRKQNEESEPSHSVNFASLRGR
jgi:hypothetical protein